MPLFGKILVPQDGSEHSLRALENAVQIAKKFSGKITLIHVYSPVSPAIVTSVTPAYETVPLAPETVSKLVEAARKVGTNILDASEKRVRAEGVQSIKLLREGHVVEEILKAAKEEGFDLIVVGARGLSSIKEILLGSVSHGVTVHAHCPVLVVK